MNREEFEAIDSSNPLPILLADGRMGLCPHWNEEGVLVDAYSGNDVEQVLVPWNEIKDITKGGGGLVQVKAKQKQMTVSDHLNLTGDGLRRALKLPVQS